jgi:hypothetical protein
LFVRCARLLKFVLQKLLLFVPLVRLLKFVQLFHLVRFVQPLSHRYRVLHHLIRTVQSVQPNRILYVRSVLLGLISLVQFVLVFST